MANINKDYLVIVDVKKSSISLGNGSMTFNILDKNTSNIFVNLVINTSTNELIHRFTNIENAEDYTVVMNIVKPNNEYLALEGELRDKEKAVFEFNLPAEAKDVTGTYNCELLTKCNINGQEEVTTSNKVSYRVKESVVNNLDDVITEAPTYPIVIELFDRLSDIERYEEDRRQAEIVRELAETARVEAESIREQEHDVAMQDIEDKIIEVEGRAVEIETSIANKFREQDETIATRFAQHEEVVEERLDTQDEVINTFINDSIARMATHEQEVTSKITQFEQEVTNEITQFEQEVVAKNTQFKQEITSGITQFKQETTSEITQFKQEVATKNIEQDNKLSAIEVINNIQNERLDKVEKKNKEQDYTLACLFAETDRAEINFDGNSEQLLNSKDGLAIVNSFEGQTMVNLNKEADKELILNSADINVTGQQVDITDGVDGGLVDVYAQGNTMVNVCNQQDSVPLTMSYTSTKGNHVTFQGDYDGKAKPYVYGNTLVNLSKFKDAYRCSEGVQSNHTVELLRNLQAGVTYTYIINVTELIPGVLLGGVQFYDVYTLTDGTIKQPNNITYRETGLQIFTFTPEEDIASIKINIGNNNIDSTQGVYPTVEIDRFDILEGDLTANLPNGHIEGLQSSFEDNLVTEGENAGKYEVEYVSTGKNKFNNGAYETNTSIQKDGTVLAYDGDRHTSSFIRVNADTDYIGFINGYRVCFYDINKVFISYYDVNVSLIATTPSNCSYMRFSFPGEVIGTLQIEEGSTATTYEPYKEYTKTLYLNSPLLEGDSIEVQGNNIVHVRRYGKVVLDGSEDWRINTTYDGNYRFELYMLNTKIVNSDEVTCFCDNYPCTSPTHTWFGTQEGFTVNSSNQMLIYFSPNYNDGTSTSLSNFKAQLSSKPATVIYPLATPTYEVISSNDNLYIDSYVSGHLDFDTAVPIEKTKFECHNFTLKYLRPSTDYNIQFESDGIGKIDMVFFGGANENKSFNVTEGVNKIALNNNDGTDKLWIIGIGCNISNIVVTEAVNEDFGYFQEMKSVGELEGNEIEIKSKNKNLIEKLNTAKRNIIGVDVSCDDDVMTLNGTTNTSGDFNYSLYEYEIELEKNTAYTLKFHKISGTCSNEIGIYVYKLTHYDGTVEWKTTPTSTNGVVTINTGTTIHKISRIRIHSTGAGIIFDNFKVKVQLEKGDTATDYVKYAEDIQTIQLSEPLRGLPNGVKDKIVKIDGKWYIERNCGEVEIVNTMPISIWGNIPNTINNAFSIETGIKNKNNDVKNVVLISDKHISHPRNYLPNIDEPGICDSQTQGNILMKVPSTNLTSYSVNAFEVWLSNNPFKVVYQLAEPIYEPIEYNPLEVYTDLARISNNSTIPCVMDVKNHGFNVMLKPSTTYTISSNQGVQTFQTGATLDDCLRLYGTGTMKDVTILEGAITDTDLIPSHFSGMESAFEQTYDESVGKYKVEIKTTGKNKFDINKLVSDLGGTLTNGVYDTTGASTSRVMPLNIKAPCTVSFTVNKPTTAISSTFSFIHSDGTCSYLSTFAEANKKFVCNFSKDIIGFRLDLWAGNAKMSNFQIEEGDTATAYEPYKSSTISFYIDEPLRGIGNVRDDVKVQDGKVIVTRRCAEVILDGSQSFVIDTASSTEKLSRFSCNIVDLKNNRSTLVSDKIPLKTNYGLVNNPTEGIFTSQGGNSLFVDLLVSKMSQNTVTGLITYLKSNPITVVYQLATPIYEEIELDKEKLFLESYKDGHISFSSNIPVMDTWVEYSVAVAMLNNMLETASITDEQDYLIVDLATQLAIMQLTM